MKIYLDACCLNRLTDDQTQLRIRAEAEAVETILEAVTEQKVEWVASKAFFYELAQNPSLTRRRGTEALLRLAAKTVGIDTDVRERGRELEAVGYGAFDALHIASSEAGGADFLLSTDDKLVRRASRGVGDPLISVQNPLSWVQEHLSDRSREHD